MGGGAERLSVGFVNHLRLSVADVEASARLYDPLLRCLGFRPEPRDDDGRAWGIAGVDGRIAWLILTPAREPGRHADFAPGLHHLALAARDRAHVDAAHAVLIAHGAEILQGPGPYDDDPGCYAVFFRDPDGIKLEIVHNAE